MEAAPDLAAAAIKQALRLYVGAPQYQRALAEDEPSFQNVTAVAKAALVGMARAHPVTALIEEAPG